MTLSYLSNSCAMGGCKSKNAVKPDPVPTPPDPINHARIRDIHITAYADKVVASVIKHYDDNNFIFSAISKSSGIITMAIRRKPQYVNAEASLDLVRIVNAKMREHGKALYVTEIRFFHSHHANDEDGNMHVFFMFGPQVLLFTIE